MAETRQQRSARVIERLKKIRLEILPFRRKLREIKDEVKILLDELNDEDSTYQEIGTMYLNGESVKVYAKKKDLENESSESLEPDSKETSTSRDTRPQRGTGWAGG